MVREIILEHSGLTVAQVVVMSSIFNTIAISALVLAIGGACTASSDEDEGLVFEDDGGKADVIRPYGTFRRALAEGEDGITLLGLNEDYTYAASQELVVWGQIPAGWRCHSGTCTEEFVGTFRFATALEGGRYIVLYDEGTWLHSLEYKLDGDALELRYRGLDDWFTMRRAEDGVPPR